MIIKKGGLIVRPRRAKTKQPFRVTTIIRLLGALSIVGAAPACPYVRAR